MATGIRLDKAVLELAAKRAIEILIDKYDSLGMRASGKWADELEYVIENNEKVVIKGMDYTEQLVNGRRPGGMPPVDDIHQWMLDKKTFSGDRSKSRAWAIAKSIANSGTVYYRDGGTDLLEVLEDPSIVEEFYNILGDHIRIVIAEQLTNDIKEAFR